jgi:hypothetical protein
LESKDPAINNLRRLLATVHSAAEAATDIEECISNAECHAAILGAHFCAFVNHLQGEAGPVFPHRLACIGLCANCAWPLYSQPNGNLMHFEFSHKLGNRCYIPKLSNGGHNGT